MRLLCFWVCDCYRCYIKVKGDKKGYTKKSEVSVTEFLRNALLYCVSRTESDVKMCQKTRFSNLLSQELSILFWLRHKTQAQKTKPLSWFALR
jgi:hypothetical protein